MGIRLRCAYERLVETIAKATDAKAGRESARTHLYARTTKATANINRRINNSFLFLMLRSFNKIQSLFSCKFLAIKIKFTK